MAAFIQKLFKSRKSPEATGKVRKEVPAPDAPQEDTRASLREAQLETLKGSPEQARLAELAVEGVTADIRLEAAGRLTDAESLQQVQKKAKGRDKSVYQSVRQALQKLREEQARLESLSQTITTLINHAKDQARSDDTKLYEARLGALTRQWAEVEAHANAEQAQSFLEAVHRCKERLAAVQSAQADEERQEEQRLQREETLALLANTLDDLKTQSPETLPSLASLDALQKTQENRWLEATRDTSVDRQQQKAYETSMLSLRNYISAVRRTTQEKDTLAELTAANASGDDGADERREQARQLIREINWPENFPMPALLESVRQLAGKPKQSKPASTEDLEKQKAIAAELEASMTSLEAALEAKQLRESRQLLKTVQQQFKSLDRRHGKPFQARMQLLNGQLRELSDWLGFATEPKQIELCEQMEYLAEQPMEPEAKAERIKELQNEWRNLGGSSDRALWTRFKAASDKAYEPCKDYFSAKSGLKRANLEKRKAICEELETFLNHADWSTIDWKAAEKIHLTARQEWKAAWPVEFRENRQVQKHFDDLLKKLEAPLDQERQKNEALKQEIVDKANALIDHEPLQDAMNQAKNLQADWQAIGITRHREDRKLWQAFRKACDQIFARRDAHRNEQQQATRAADEAAAPVIEESRKLSSEDDGSTLSDALSKLHELQVSALSATLKDKVQGEKQRLKQALTEQQLRADVSYWQSLVMARLEGPADAAQVPGHWPELAAGQDSLDHGELVIRAEILGGITSPDFDQQRRMEIQVQRLAEGMGSTEPASNEFRELEKLVARWCLQPADASPDEALAKRLSNALAAVVPG
ncbi:DUF349 domain-containing protein [Marinobacter sp. M216]|uniref:DUF349 domain-containing protein n=1 Tax=Marinobacter albus TaxID=3030833 RepID=A0ABT7HEY7_9GAMM|nr:MULTISPECIES: DUF349 domain-containing protein [unclassified Marinobacter]MBW7472381.1 DUF349 domain-containing protein [Marinobacter sp. F4218]MDK9558931.1 DUF349 domain-containing protein [Marinobacter sp. M216]